MLTITGDLLCQILYLNLLILYLKNLCYLWVISSFQQWVLEQFLYCTLFYIHMSGEINACLYTVKSALHNSFSRFFLQTVNVTTHDRILFPSTVLVKHTDINRSLQYLGFRWVCPMVSKKKSYNLQYQMW